MVNLLLQSKELRYFRLNLCQREVVELDVLFYAPFCVCRIKLALPTLPPAERRTKSCERPRRRTLSLPNEHWQVLVVLLNGRVVGKDEIAGEVQSSLLLQFAEEVKCQLTVLRTMLGHSATTRSGPPGPRGREPCQRFCSSWTLTRGQRGRCRRRRPDPLCKQRSTIPSSCSVPIPRPCFRQRRRQRRRR